MTNDTYSFFAQNGTMKIAKKGTAIASMTTVAAVQNCSFEVQFETNDLYSWGTVKRVDSARYEAKVNVTLEYVKVLAEDFFKYILSPDDSASSGASLASGVSIADTTDLYRFDVYAEIPDTTRSKVMKITATDVYFKNLPLSGELGEWMKLNLEGNGADITLQITDYSSNNSALADGE